MKQKIKNKQTNNIITDNNIKNNEIKNNEIKNNIFTIPLFNIWYLIITVLFLTSQYFGIIDWSPIWLFSPLWIPAAFSLICILIIYFLKFLIFIYENYNRH